MPSMVFHTTQDNGLYIVATPIGNLQDITLRAVEILKSVDTIACEDTRVSKKLLNHLGITTPLTPYHEHNASKARPKLLNQLKTGQSIALISDAGTPLISDPGYKLVAEAVKQGINIIPIPGASSVIASLVACGLPTDQFAFLGFLPTQQSQAVGMLQLWQSIPVTLVCFTTPGKIIANLTLILEILGECDVAVGRELTKLHEEFIRGQASELLAIFQQENQLRGELVLVFRSNNPPSQNQLAAADIDALLKDLLLHMSVKSAVDIVVKHCHQPKKHIYQRALELKG